MEKDYDLLLYSNFIETRNRLVNTSSRIGLLFLIDVILLYVYIQIFYFLDTYQDTTLVVYMKLLHIFLKIFMETVGDKL